MRTIMYADVADPPLLVDLAVRAEQRSWNGVFLWDHILWKSSVRAVADAWVALSAIAARTRHIRLDPLVTPLSRRRVHKVARETATLDHLSHRRLILGVGLGASTNNELEQFGRVCNPLGTCGRSLLPCLTDQSHHGLSQGRVRGCHRCAVIRDTRADNSSHSAKWQSSRDNLKHAEG
jgi:hypothetical protein